MYVIQRTEIKFIPNDLYYVLNHINLLKALIWNLLLVPLRERERIVNSHGVLVRVTQQLWGLDSDLLMLIKFQYFVINYGRV